MAQVMRWEYDPMVDAGYAELGDGPVARTERLGSDRMIDYDVEDTILGYEFLNVSRGVDLDRLPHAAELAVLLAEHNIRVLV